MAFVRFLAATVLTMTGAAVLVWGLMSQDIRASGQDTVTLARGSVVSLATPAFIQSGKRYTFTWPGGGPPQTFIVKDVRPDGWILVEVAEENVDPAFMPPGSVPSRWLNAALATSIQEMRALVY
ncbi:MAG TPA: hypothetical protein VD833_10570 [Vicinamibacterales bacterium]|nr:hypothetical protein [Vicinamibacterales bacterium]